jgi:CRISPR/Cas system CSM-associated protein Csm3 (group 7 of RAMP superfamily)
MSNGRSPRVIYDVKATIKLLSPLHVGSGRSVTIDTVVGKAGSNLAPEVAGIVRDGKHLPYLPGTTIKGLLRRLAKAKAGVDADSLFGRIKSDGDGIPGSITVFGARCMAAPDIADAPFVAGAEQQLGRGVFVAARTRIDPESGTAGDHTLFHQEMVANGTTFELRLRIDARARINDHDLVGAARDDHGLQTARAVRTDRDVSQDASEVLQDLLGVLHELCAEDGRAIGKGQADGFGRVKLAPESIVVTGRALQSNGAFAAFTPTYPRSIAAEAAAEPLRFVCKGPFLVVDASKRVKPGDNPEGERPHISPQSWRERLPMLLGSSVSGALRARARWLAMRQLLRAGKNDGEIRATDPEDFLYRKDTSVGGLSSVQRLFGVAGFRGRLGIARLRVHEATPWDVTSVKLDRFTGGPVDNALFKTRGFLGVVFDLVLALEQRPTGLGAQQRADDETLFDDILADIRANGLILGHGGNKGFGWFSCEEKRR